MDQAIVFAAQQFLGFEICKELLNQGYEVMAIEHEQMVNDYSNEKWLEIGRNANVTYQPLNTNIDLNDQSYIWFIPLYDLFTVKNEKLIMDWTINLQKLYEESKSSIERIIFINPVKWSSNERKANEHFYKKLKNEVFNSEETPVIEFQLPTIFGPWQPNCFLFQQIISESELNSYFDDLMDAIYVEDAVHSILENMDDKFCGKTVYLQSETGDNWRKCVLYLNPSYPLPERSESMNRNNVEILKVKESISFKEGIDKQIACYSRKKQ